MTLSYLESTFELLLLHHESVVEAVNTSKEEPTSLIALSALKSALTAREVAALEYGLAVIDWHQSGGTVEFLEPGVEIVDEDDIAIPAVPPVLPTTRMDSRNCPVETEVSDVADAEVLMPALQSSSSSVIQQAPQGGCHREPSSEPEEPREPPRGKPASLESLMSLASSFGEGAPSVASPSASLSGFLENLGPLKKIKTKPEAFAAADALCDMVVQELEDLLQYSKTIQRQVLAMLAARARYLQDEVSKKLKVRTPKSLNRTFSELTAFGKTHQPGFVVGLSRGQRPEHARTWFGEARHWWDVLGGNHASRAPEDEELNPERCLLMLATEVGAEEPKVEVFADLVDDCLKAGVRRDDQRLLKLVSLDHVVTRLQGSSFRGLRKAIRTFLAEDEVEEESGSVLPEDWPFWHHVRGKRCVLLGGDNRSDAARRISETFEFESLDWVSGYSSAKTQALARRIEHGKVDIVLYLARFLSHDSWELVKPSTRATGVPLLIVERGYGISAIQALIERSLEPAVSTPE